MRVISGLILLLTILPVFAQQAAPEVLVRRLYINLLDRFPSVEEVRVGRKKIVNYEGFVDELLAEKEFSGNLAQKITTHYFPDLRDKRNSAGEVDPKFFKRFNRMKMFLQKDYLPKKDFRYFIKDLVGGRGASTGRGALYFYEVDEPLEKLTGRFADRVLGIPLKCAQCHDHREYGDMYQLDFWSLAALFQNTKVVELKTIKEIRGLRNFISKEFNTRIMSNLMTKEDKTHLQKWIVDETKGRFLFKGEDMEWVEKIKKTRKNSDNILIEDQLLVLEKKIRINNLKVKYSDGRDDYVKAAVPGQTASPNIAIEPRTYLADWVISKKNPYLKKAVTNWVSNWLFGRAFRMPLTDIYGKGKNDKLLNEYSEFLVKNKFNLKALVKKMVMSDFYKSVAGEAVDMPSIETFKQRTLRQVPAPVIMKLVMKEEKDSKVKFLRERQVLEGVISNFPRHEDNCESSFSGTVNQSLFISFDSFFTGYIRNESAEAVDEDKLKSLIPKFFSREATDQEIKLLSDILKDKKDKERETAYGDLLWVLINSPEMRLY